VEVYGEEDEEEKEKKRAMVEVKSEPVDVELGSDNPQGQGAVASAEDNANTAVALAVNIASSEKRKENPFSGSDEVKLKKKKLLDAVLQNISDKKSTAGGESKGSNNAAKHSKLKRKASETSNKASDKNSKTSDTSSKASDASSKVANKAMKGGGGEAVSQQGRRGSISSTTGQQAMDRVMNAGASKTTKIENTSVKVTSSTLMSNKGGGAATEASRRKSEPSSTIQASLAAKGKPQASKLSTQGRKRQTKADTSDLESLQSKKVLASSSSMENLPGLTITPNPNIAPQPHPTNSNLPILPVLSVPVLSNLPLPHILSANASASAEAAVMDLKPSDDDPAAAVNQSEAVSQVDAVEKIPQKVAGVQAGEGEKGCNYSLTCELCQKENKTLQSLYTHVIVHIRVELERKVKDLMEGFQCKVCDQVFKAKAPLLQHIGCKHGKVNDILREKGYSVLPCLLATNSKGGAEMQANLVQIKKEKANILAE